MAILKIGTETFNETEHTVVLLTGRAIRDGEDATVNKPCARVSVAAKQEPDGSTLFVTVKGWRDRYRDVLRIRKGDQIRLGTLTAVPASCSSIPVRNNYQPTPYEEGTAEYQRVLDKLAGLWKGKATPVD